jgi:hypothetical protein
MKQLFLVPITVLSVPPPLFFGGWHGGGKGVTGERVGRGYYKQHFVKQNGSPIRLPNIAFASNGLVLTDKTTV